MKKLLLKEVLQESIFPFERDAKFHQASEWIGELGESQAMVALAELFATSFGEKDLSEFNLVIRNVLKKYGDYLNK